MWQMVASRVVISPKKAGKGDNLWWPESKEEKHRGSGRYNRHTLGEGDGLPEIYRERGPSPWRWLWFPEAEWVCGAFELDEKHLWIILDVTFLSEWSKGWGLGYIPSYDGDLRVYISLLRQNTISHHMMVTSEGTSLSLGRKIYNSLGEKKVWVVFECKNLRNSAKKTTRLITWTTVVRTIENNEEKHGTSKQNIQVKNTCWGQHLCRCTIERR